MGKTSARALRGVGMQYYQQGLPWFSMLNQYLNQPKPEYSEEEALGYLPEASRMGYGKITDWLQGKDVNAALAEGLINQILAGNLYNQPGVKSNFEAAIENPIMDVLREETMPQIAASSGKGGTYFSTMRGQAEIDAMQSAADKIAELESGYILDQMTQARLEAMGLPTAKAQAGMGAGEMLRGAWEKEQPYYGGGNVPLIQSSLKTLQPFSTTGAETAQQYEAIASQERQAKMAGMTSGFNSAMGAAGSVGGGYASSGGCCFMFIMGEGKVTDNVQKFKYEHFGYNSDVANGYRWMSLKLMPYVTKSKFVKSLVRHLITKPLAKFAECFYKNDKRGLLYAPAGIFWATTWDLIGKLAKYNSKPYQEMVAKLGI